MVAAPSGAGKSSLVNAFLERNHNWSLSISTTTRSPRPGEVNGREYFFVALTEFESRIARGDFLEWARVHGNLYGTSKDWIQAQLAECKNIILEIDWQGAQQIRRIFSNSKQGVRPVSVFILPPSVSVLGERLRARGQDSEVVIAERLAAAEEEISHANEFDYVIINQDFSNALCEFEVFANQLLNSD